MNCKSFIFIYRVISQKAVSISFIQLLFWIYFANCSLSSVCMVMEDHLQLCTWEGTTTWKFMFKFTVPREFLNVGYKSCPICLSTHRRALISSKTKRSKKVYMLHLERESLLSSSSGQTWRVEFSFQCGLL